MRQIDNMTPQEIDMLRLKGMLSEKATRKPTLEQETMKAMAQSIDAHRDKIAVSEKAIIESMELSFLDGVQFGLKLAEDLKEQVEK